MDHREHHKSGWGRKPNLMTEPDYTYILNQLPYREPFLFVDRIDKLDTEIVEGRYTFQPESDFYRGHFKGSAVTPGVLLTECCAQIGLACLGLYLLRSTGTSGGEVAGIGMSEAQMEFLHPVYPGDTVKVTAVRQYFRFNKLKVAVKLFNEQGLLACRGQLSGRFKPSSK